MNTKQAILTVKNTVTDCESKRLADIVTILELGGGNLFLADKTLEDKRHSAIMELVDAVAFSTYSEQDEYQPEAEFIPCYAGSLELVLASLVIDQDWERIADMAKRLEEDPQLEWRKVGRGTPQEGQPNK